MPVKLTCDAEGFEGNTITVSGRWTRGDTKHLESLDDETYIEFLKSKLSACNLEIYDDDGAVVETITTPADLTLDQFDRFDEVVVGWLGGALYTFVGNRRTLGNLSARVSSSTNGKMPAPIQTTETES